MWEKGRDFQSGPSGWRNVLFPRGRISGNLSESYFTVRGREMPSRYSETCAHLCRSGVGSRSRLGINRAEWFFFVPYSCSKTGAHFAHKRTRNNLSSRSHVTASPKHEIFLLPRIHSRVNRERTSLRGCFKNDRGQRCQKELPNQRSQASVLMASKERTDSVGCMVVSPNRF